MNERIILIRRKADMTQDEFATRMSISKNYVSLIENGKKTPSERLIADICREFNVNEDWLRTGNGEMKNIRLDDYTSVVVDIDRNDPKARQAILDYWQLNDNDKKLWWKFIERFINKSGD